MLSRIAAALALALAATAPAHAAPVQVISEAAALPQSVSHLVVHSDRLKRDFELWISVPSTTLSLPGQKLPTIYALDAGLGIAGPEGTLLASAGAMAPAIVVGVGYRPTGGLFRNLDLTHVKFRMLATAPPIGGGGAAFEAFLLEDLEPLIEARYPADPGRTVLFGHSLGGLFAANVFADNPNAFSAYIIGSPSVWADPDVVARVAAAARRAHGRRVYLAVGANERGASIDPPPKGAGMVDGFQKLAAALMGHPGIVLKTQIYAGETHVSYYPRLVADGFPYALPPGRNMTVPQVKLPDAMLAGYVGVYAMSDGRKFAVTRDDTGQLFGQIAAVPKAALVQDGPGRFYAPVLDLHVAFEKAGGAGLLNGGSVEMRIEKEKTVVSN